MNILRLPLRRAGYADVVLPLQRISFSNSDFIETKIFLAPHAYLRTSHACVDLAFLAHAFFC